MDISIIILTEDASRYTTYPFLEELIPRIIYCLIKTGDCNPLFISHIERGNFPAGRFVDSASHSIYKYSGYNLIIIHQDANSNSEDNVLRNKFEPLFRVLGQRRNDDIAPVIPVRMIEAWLCVDKYTFINLGHLEDNEASETFPNNPREVEGITNPKTALELYIRENTRGGRRRLPSLQSMYYPMASEVDLDRLGTVPAFSNFRDKLKRALNYINP